MTERRLLLVNGPNLNLLGTRQPEVYGSTTLAEIESRAAEVAGESGLRVRSVQSNHEGVLVDAIHAAGADCAGIVINPAAYSHTSV
nr:type II 3-dehydroquinate dehydratase [Actinomycetes bacterium]